VKRSIRPATAALLCAALACRAPVPRDGEAPPLHVPASFAAAAADDSTTVTEDWWTAFGSEELSLLVEEVLARNYDLIAAAHRLRAAEAQARIAGAALLPAASLGGDASRQRQNFIGLPLPGGGPEVLSSTSSSLGVSLNVSWELDLWGKLDAYSEAAEADFAAGVEDLASLRLSLAGQAVKSWLGLVDARLQLEIAARQVESLERSTEVVRQRFENGRVTALDLNLAEAELAGALARRSAREEAQARAARGLEILRGSYPAGALESAAALPELPPQPSVGLPSELLRRRPDLRAAEVRLDAEDYRLYASRKELWPSLSLTGSVGRRTAEAGDLGDDAFSVWSLLAGLTQPIFQGGRLSAGVDAAEAKVDATLAEYAQAVLRALLEVETALAVEASMAERDRQLARATERADQARGLAEERYRAGRTDILSVLTAQRQAYESESAWVNARRLHLEQRVDLMLALGGGLHDGDAEPDTATNTSR